MGGLLLFSSLLPALGPAVTEANAAPSAEIRVSLFGQPCILQGPTDERALRMIHSLSPEQLYPQSDSNLSSAPTRRALEKLRAITGAPAGLDHYRERLAKRLQAQLGMLEAIETYLKDHKSASLIAVSKGSLTGRHLKDFETAVKKAESAKSLAKHDTLDALFDTFSDGIEPDPEEEFHRAIQRMNVQYTCSFEENGDAAGGEDSAD